MIAAATQLPRPPLYGIASYSAGAEEFEYELGWDEFERDTVWAQSQLQVAGLASGDLVLVSSNNSEGPWINPVVHALRRIGVTYLPVEVWEWDARRASMFLQRLPVKAVFGLGAETINGLQSQTPPIAELLQNVEMVWARPDALHALPAALPKVGPFVILGPATAIGLPGSTDAIVNAAEWTVDSEDGQLVVTNARIRATSFNRAPTGVRGVVRSITGDSITIELDSGLRNEPGARTP